VDIKTTLIHEIEAYTGDAYNGYVFMTSNVERTRFVVTAVGNVKGKRVVNTSLIVQLIGEKIIIEQDTNSNVLIDALEQAGVPRSQIVLAYVGEPVPAMA
jgi:hypothetical protein